MIMDCYGLNMSLGLDVNTNAQFILNPYFLMAYYTFYLTK
jgi:hypothetical protein